ncbi:HIT domain-containing protein [Candidatus Lariskella endosymbiont of Epinotia ramella]
MSEKIYNADNIFAKILRREIQANVIYEDAFSLAFNDIAPAAPVHVLVIPKFECISFNDFVQKADPSFVSSFFLSVQKVAKLLGLEESGYRIVANHGNDAEQTVYHFHIHLLGKKHLGKFIS